MKFLLLGIGFATAATLLSIGIARLVAPKPVASKAIKNTQLSAVPDLPQPFGYKLNWLALKADNAQAVFEAIGLIHQEPANWETGLQFAYSEKYEESSFPVFVTPPVDGWVLAVTKFGFSSDSAENIAELEALLGQLSTQFGESQFFGSYRVVDYIAWYRATGGRITRGFSFADGVLFANKGETTSVELDAGIMEMSGMDEGAFWDKILEDEKQNFEALDEEAPMRIAAKWSVDPLGLAAFGDLGTGLAGVLVK